MVRARRHGKKAEALRITVLTYLESEGAARDIVVEQVVAALRACGYVPSVLAVHGDLRRLTTGLARRKPDLVFNLMEMFGDDVRADVSVAALLDLLKVPYTGSGPGELYLAQDKALGKKLLHYHEVDYPKFAVFSLRDNLETGGRLRMPLFVKPANMDASIGIDAGALVHDANALMRRVLSIHEDCHDDALAEEFIDGREIYVGILGNETPTALPAVEMSFDGMPKDAPHVMDARAKFDEASAEWKGTRAVIADLAPELEARIRAAALEAYRALRVKDYGRVDLRVTAGGDIYVIEVNASCYLEQKSELAMAAAAAGIEYAALIGRIVEIARARYSVEGT